MLVNKLYVYYDVIIFVINKTRQYGTLDTLDEWDWSYAWNDAYRHWARKRRTS